MKIILLFIMLACSCSLIKKGDSSLTKPKGEELFRYKFVKCSTEQDSVNIFERIDTIQIIRKYLTNLIFVQTDFTPYFPLREKLMEEDTAFIDTFKQVEKFWYTFNGEDPKMYFNKDSIHLGEYGNVYSNSSTFYLKDMYIDSCTFNGEFVAKLRWDVFSKSQFSGGGAFNKGETFCFSPEYGWIMGYPYNDNSEIYRLVQIISLDKRYKKDIDFKNLKKWMLE